MFSVVTSKVFGAVALALLLLLGVQTFRVDRLSDKLETQTALTKSWKEAQATTRRSLDQLVAALEQKNAESRARAKVLDDAKANVVAAEKRNAAAYRNTQAKIDAVRGATVRGCETPKEVHDALADL